ncbi:zeta toxin family protein [Enterococcus sp. 1001283B150225_161107_E12]|uniref:zeta toxin family protein n=1 Tax=Enterococcus sp. 1001283B150225_161107_E12 TaxID=2787145 RepID=UPI00189CEEA7|nr:zeta toxin family protein [Enterococcus sp. 1001283B150225_161107_E12]
MQGKSKTTDQKEAIFMAGTPGAGKTEVAISLLELSEDICRIDADIFRAKFPGYTGSNSSDFQSGSSWLVDYSLDMILKNGYSFLLDGTFAIGRAKQNIERCLSRDYDVTIYFIFQDPLIVWDYTKIREKVEGRFVPKDRFINAYFRSRDNVREVIKQYDESISVHVILKDYNNGIATIVPDISDIDLILPELFTAEELEEKLYD